MKDTTNLIDAMHGRMLMDGEPARLEDMADIVMDAQVTAGYDFTSAELYGARIDAVNLFVDSYVQNEHDTELCHFAELARCHTENTGEHSSIDIERDKCIAEWEAMRPIAVFAERLKAIDALTN